VLNRLFVIVGLFVILAIGAAFVVPRFIQWSDYRGRLENMAAESFGTEVAIAGDISLTLLPQPRLVFTDVRVGPAAAPALAVEKVEAAFSLLDFLSDRYKVTRLVLEHPVATVTIGADGSVQSGIGLAPASEPPIVSIDNAEVVAGTLRVADARADRTYEVDELSGQLRLEALGGPFSFSGTAQVAGADYALRLATGTRDAGGATTLSLYVKGAGDGFTLESTGVLQTGAVPHYAGELKFRQPPSRPQEGEAVDAGRGDLVLDGKLEAGLSRVLLSNYVLLPDENRAAIRLTGAAELKLGATTAFNAIVSGGVVALPPRDATKELTEPPYEIVRLLGETPLPPVPPLPGTIGLDIAELNLRGLSLRDLRLDASTDGRSWTIGTATAALPGDTALALTGNLSVVDGHPIFAGGISAQSRHLDRLAALWRAPAAGNPLLNMQGALTADLALSSDTLTLSAGTLVVAGINHGFDAAIGFGPARSLKLAARLTTLGQEESAALAALLPDVTGSGSFGATFPRGELSVSARRAVVFGLAGSDLAAEASWEGGVLQLSRLKAVDLGGAAIDAHLTAFGTLAQPEFSGGGEIAVGSDAPIVAALLRTAAAPPAVGAFIERSLPARLGIQLDAPAGDGGQALKLTGRLGTADAHLSAHLGAGIASAFTAPLAASFELTSESPTLMTAQLGLGDVALFDDRTPLHLAASIEGVPTNSYEVHARLAGGADHIAFDGNVVAGDFSRITGDGTVEAALGDPAALVALAGAGGIHVPPVSGTAHLRFAGGDTLALDEIAAAGVTGSLRLDRRNGAPVVSGALALPSADAGLLLPLLAGPAATVAGDGVWPEGPIDIGTDSRAGEGRVDIAVASVTAGARPLLSDVTFGLHWTAQAVGINRLSGKAGAGTLGLDAELCCANAALPAKRLSGRVTIDGVALDLVLPPALGAGLDGIVDASAEFDGTGESLAEAVAALSGSGSYTIRDFSAAAFNPATFEALSGLVGILDMTPDALASTVTTELAAAPFEAGLVSGSFTIAGGVLRSPNLAIAGQGARIFGRGSVALDELAVDGRYVLSPTILANPDGAVETASAEVAAEISGPLWAPVTRYDVQELVDAMKIRASEIELARLEQLRAEDEARQRAAAEERARIAAEQAAAAEAARKAAEEEAARKKQAEEEAAAKAAAERPPPPPAPMDLGLGLF
jgi:hypothetical protein